MESPPKCPNLTLSANNCPPAAYNAGFPQVTPMSAIHYSNRYTILNLCPAPTGSRLAYAARAAAVAPTDRAG